jgi:NAD(P)H-nitrite reductase large subunit
VIAGGGLLGIEAGYALHKLGLRVTVLERSDRPLRRQLDARAGQVLREYLQGLGIEVLLRAETAAVQGETAVQRVALRDGRSLDCDLFLVCAGITPNTELARGAGLEIRRGIVVDDHLRTSAPEIYAVGDAADYRGQVSGLWPVAVEQAETAAINVVGGDKTYAGSAAATILKVVGVDLASIGRFEPASSAERVIALEEADEHRYRKLVLDQGRIAGAILLGYPQDAPAVTAAVKHQVDVSPHLRALEAGDWQVLSGAR